MKVEMLDKRYSPECWGFILSFLNEGDNRPAREQLDAGYAHGGGWSKFDGFKMIDAANMVLQYPGDPPMEPIAKARFRDELVYLYPHAWVLVMHNGTWEISRMD